MAGNTKKDCHWFIHPEDKQTNDAIYETMNRMGLVMATSSIIPTSLRESVPVIETDVHFIGHLERSKKNKSLLFKIYWQRGDTVRRWRLHEPEVKKKAQAMARIARQKQKGSAKASKKT